MFRKIAFYSYKKKKILQKKIFPRVEKRKKLRKEQQKGR